MNPNDYASIARSMIEHENEILNHRMTWMWTLQGLLLGAASFAWGKNCLLLIAIATLGLLSAVSFGLSFISSDKAVRNIIDDWHNFSERNPGYLGPPIIGTRKDEIIPTFYKPWGGLPWFVAFLWPFLVIVRFL